MIDRSVCPPDPGAAELAGTDTLLRRLAILDARLDIEQSFKVSRAGVSCGRILVGMDSAGLDRGRLEALLRGLAMPAEAVRALLEQLPAANKLGFGFEERPGGGTCKVYLEFWDRLVSEVRAGPDKRRPRLLFLGFKWDVARPHGVTVDRYICYPLLPVRGIVARIEAMGRTAADDFPCEAVTRLVRAASRVLVQDSFVYTEVWDPGGGRASFDVNLYKSGLLLGQAGDLLRPTAVHFGLAWEDLAAVLRAGGHCRLGHLSGGRDRGGGFVTVYYETEPDAQVGTLSAQAPVERPHAAGHP